MLFKAWRLARLGLFMLLYLLFTFTLIQDDITKSTFLKTLCRTVANIACRNDVENFLVSMDPHHLDIETSDVSLTNALSKALKFATRTGRKVSRAFSFNKSPSKLKRAVSTVMSPFGTLPQQSSMRGATSVNNLADLSLSGTPPTGGFAHPMATPTSRRRTLKNAHWRHLPLEKQAVSSLLGLPTLTKATHM